MFLIQEYTAPSLTFSAVPGEQEEDNGKRPQAEPLTHR